MQTEAATLTCIVSNILETTTITWKYGVTGVTTTGGKYAINTLAYNLKEKTVTSELDITAAQLAILAAASAQAFTCSADVGTPDIALTSTAVFLQIFSKWKLELVSWVWLEGCMSVLHGPMGLGRIPNFSSFRGISMT